MRAAATGRPPLVAIDGRSSAGKTTLAARLAEAIPGAATVHTDDVAWWHSCFDWTELLIAGVLEPLRRGEAVRFRPPAWDERDRPGAIEVPAGPPLVIVEGVGAGRRELARFIEAIVWVQSDVDEMARRTAARQSHTSGVERWMAEEWPFVAAQRTWERAFAVVAGTPEIPYDEAAEVVMSANAP